MSDETEHLSKTLVFTLSVIIDSDAEKRQRIALAYQEAELLVATIPLDNGDARSRIKACVKRFDHYKAAGDVASAGWMLKAIQERVDEQNLPGWRKLREVIGPWPSRHGTETPVSRPRETLAETCLPRNGEGECDVAGIANGLAAACRSGRGARQQPQCHRPRRPAFPIAPLSVLFVPPDGHHTWLGLPGANPPAVSHFRS